jgi:hypothetical protein
LTTYYANLPIDRLRQQNGRRNNIIFGVIGLVVLMENGASYESDFAWAFHYERYNLVTISIPICVSLQGEGVYWVILHLLLWQAE